MLQVEILWDVRLCRTAVLLKVEVLWDVRFCRTVVLLKIEVLWVVRFYRTAVLLKIEVFALLGCIERRCCCDNPKSLRIKLARIVFQ